MLNKINIVPEVTYENADVLRLVILKDNRKRAGIYRWVNKLNGKSYVGSSLDLARRLNYYYNLSFLAGYAANKKKRKINSIIYRSLLKYGYSNFKLEILEYCDTLNVIQREQYYIDLIKPEYNILEIAGSLRGFKHSESTKELLRKYSMENKTWVVNFAEATGESTNVVNRCTHKFFIYARAYWAWGKWKIKERNA
jgi:group I intron endonuclease